MPIMQNKLEQLKNRLHIKGKKVLVGIGNLLKGDDAVGCYLAERLQNSMLCKNKDYVIINAGATPENFLEKIIKEKPATVVFLDAFYTGKNNESWDIIEAKDIGNFSLSTHSQSLTMLVNYIKAEVESADIFVLGIKPENTRLNTPISLNARQAVLEIMKVMENNA